MTIVLILLLTLFSCSNPNTSEVKENNCNPTDTTKISKTEIITDTIQEEKYYDLSIEHLLGKIDRETDTMLVPVPRNKCRLRKEYIHREVLEPYLEMHAAAAKENINLDIISVTRPFHEQQIIWETRFDRNLPVVEAAKNVLRYIAMPGTSRHHWGTDIDVISTQLNYYNTERGKREYQWMVDNAHKFGFYQVYTAGRETGYNEEKWHWTYFPVSKHYQKQYREKIDYSHIVGFPGWEAAEKLDVIENYVFGINPKLLKYEKE